MTTDLGCNLGLRRSPVERQRRLAEGEAIEVTCHGALQAFELSVHAGIDAHLERDFAGVDGDEAFAWPIRAACILREYDGAVLRCELNREVVLPVLAQLLEIFAGARGRHRGDC